MKAILSAAAACLAILCGPVSAAGERPVPASEVRSRAENDTLRCMNPNAAGGRGGLMAVWRPARNGGFEFVAIEIVDGNGGLFTVTQPFALKGDRRCYTVETETIHFGTIGSPTGPGIADARRRWLIGLKNEIGKRFRIAFLRDPDTCLARRRQWVDGAPRENPVEEVRRLMFLAPADPTP